MLDFISWIELKNGKILFLTDREIFSEQGKQVFKDCRDNDVAGYGAIRTFFAPSENGKERGKLDFWETETLPEELKEKLSSVEQFDKHWKRIFESGAFSNEALH